VRHLDIANAMCDKYTVMYLFANISSSTVSRIMVSTSSKHNNQPNAAFSTHFVRSEAFHGSSQDGWKTEKHGHEDEVI
jgi:hypothetical protein